MNAPDRLVILPVAAVLCCSLSASQEASAAQEGAPAPRISAGPIETTTEVLLASDGRPAGRGRVPAGTSDAARLMWEQMVGAVGAPDRGASEPRPRAFDLQFSARFRREGEGTQEGRVRLRYLEAGPGFVSGAILENDGSIRSVQMRGLTEGDRLGYWFRKYRGSGITDGWVKLTQRDYKEDRQEVDSYAAISYDFARLIEPESCRVVALEERTIAPSTDLAAGWLQFVGDAGIQLPPNDLDGRREGRVRTLRALSAELVWLELSTPDFRLVQESLQRRERLASEKQVKRVVFGLDPKTHRPQLVVVAPTAEAALQVPGTTLVQTTDWFELGQGQGNSRFPGKFLVYETAREAEAPRGLGFDPTPRADFFTLDGCALDAPLTPADFAPAD
ncbi:MAG: hypothetical protein VX015_02945 [Planctomycetota bacterium]|nr:hypothetical protein [Planctomycetota bacterium]